MNGDRLRRLLVARIRRDDRIPDQGADTDTGHDAGAPVGRAGKRGAGRRQVGELGGDFGRNGGFSGPGGSLRVLVHLPEDSPLFSPTRRASTAAR